MFIYYKHIYTDQLCSGQESTRGSLFRVLRVYSHHPEGCVLSGCVAAVTLVYIINRWHVRDEKVFNLSWVETHGAPWKPVTSS